MPQPPPRPAPEVERGRVRGSHKGFRATCWGGSLSPYPTPGARAALALPHYPPRSGEGSLSASSVDTRASWTRKDLRPGGRGHAFLIATGPREGALPCPGPGPLWHLPQPVPFPPSQDWAPRPLPNHLSRASFSGTPFLGPRRKFGSREGRNGHPVTRVPDSLTQALGRGQPGRG